MYLYLSVVLALHNKALLSVGTSLHVAAYGVISYSEAFFYLIFEGIAMGIQPIASFNAGAGNWARVLRVRNLALGVTLLVALCGMLPLYLWPEGVVYLFAGDNAALLPVASLGIWLYFWGLPMEGLLLVGATYFQAINRARIASLLTGGKLVLIGGFLWGFSSLWGGIRRLAGAAHLQHPAGTGDVAGDEQGGAPAQRCLTGGHSAMKKAASAAFFVLNAPACARQVSGLRA